MNTQQRRTQLTRLAIAGAFLLAGLVTTVETTLAGPPYVDAGGPGGGSASEVPTLVGSGPDRELVVASTDEVPTLVGSGPDREIVADSDDQHIAGTLDEAARSIDLANLQLGSIIASGTVDETARSIDLGTLSPQTSTTIASAETTDDLRYPH